MKLKKVIIENFRCFKNYELELAPECTILFGKNGVGKSALIQAIRNLSSFMFSSDKMFEGNIISGGVPDLGIKPFRTSDFYFNTDERKIAEYASIKGVADDESHEIKWELRQSSGTKKRIQHSLYRDAFLTLTDLLKKGSDYPLLVYFSDSFPHRKAKISENVLPYTTNSEIPRNMGYYQWDLESSCTAFWEARICNSLNAIIQQPYNNNANLSAHPFANETDFIIGRLIEFSKKLPGEYAITNVSPLFDNKAWHLNLWFPDNSSQTLHRLPAGYRRLFSIVLEIAYRAYILNKNTEPDGIVIIDEIDLHLHPELEQTIVSALTRTFPKIQFIFSTHSPMVLTNIENNGTNLILKMDKHGNKPYPMPDIYGLDYDSSISQVMDVIPRASEIDSLIDSYYTIKSENNKELTDAVFNQLAELVNSKNEAQRLIDKADK